MSTLVKTGIVGLDEILRGGIPRHNNLIVEGPPGSGKTTLGLGFIYAGAAHYDEPGAIVSFELDSAKLLRDAAGFNWDLQGLIDQGKNQGDPDQSRRAAVGISQQRRRLRRRPCAASAPSAC